MSDTDVAEILKLPAEERLRLVGIIWASLVIEPSSVPLGDAQRVVIDERLAEEDSAASYRSPIRFGLPHRA
jgi:putative addiction module component (TIGR02574 family)